MDIWERRGMLLGPCCIISMRGITTGSFVVLKKRLLSPKLNYTVEQLNVVNLALQLSLRYLRFLPPFQSTRDKLTILKISYI